MTNGVLFLDLCKSFDTVDHKIILKSDLFTELKTNALTGLNRICIIENNSAWSIIQHPPLRR
jgi:hypothetical protein